MIRFPRSLISCSGRRVQDISVFSTTISTTTTTPSPRFYTSAAFPSISTTVMSTSESSAAAPSKSGFYSLKAQLPNGNEYDFEQLRGKPVLIVNTASKWCVSNCSLNEGNCGLTVYLPQRLHPPVHGYVSPHSCRTGSFWNSDHVV